MKKVIMAVTAVAALAFAGVATAQSIGPVGPYDGVEGCVIAGAGTCTYNPTGAGGLAGQGSFSLTLTFASSTGKAPYALSAAELAEQGCAMWTSAATGAKYTDVVSVAGTVADNQSGVAFGNPFPTDPTGATSGNNAVSNCA